MDSLDCIERHETRILDVDHQVRPALGCDLTHRAEHLATVSNKHLISYCDCVLHDVVLQVADAIAVWNIKEV